MSNNYIAEIKKILSLRENISYAFVFGSATNQLLPESDIDILVGADLDASRRMDLAFELELALKRKVDIVLAKDASCEVVLQAFNKGFAVLVNDKERLKKDYFKNFHAHEDAYMLRKLRASRIKRRYSYGE